jgi:hypothetical protein
MSETQRTPGDPADRRYPSSSEAQDPDWEPGIVADETREQGLPPGADTRGEPESIPGQAGWGEPVEDAPAEGRLAPGSEENEPPP